MNIKLPFCIFEDVLYLVIVYDSHQA